METKEQKNEEEMFKDVKNYSSKYTQTHTSWSCVTKWIKNVLCLYAITTMAAAETRTNNALLKHVPEQKQATANWLLDFIMTTIKLSAQKWCDDARL